VTRIPFLAKFRIADIREPARLVNASADSPSLFTVGPAIKHPMGYALYSRYSLILFLPDYGLSTFAANGVRTNKRLGEQAK
jgi:hypothetical protein